MSDKQQPPSTAPEYRQDYFWMIQTGKLPYDGVGFRASHAEWENIKRAVDALYEQVTDEQIDQHNRTRPGAHNRYLDVEYKPESAQSNREYRPQPGYVYLLKAEDTGLFKIGKSKNPTARFEQLNKTSPFTLTVMAMIVTPDMKETEEHWHQRFANQREKGEWFRLHASDTAEFAKVGIVP